MRPKAFLLIVFVLPLWLSGQDLQFGIPFRLDVGSCYARVDGDIHKEVSQLPGVAINISSGIQATYRERVGLRVEMGYFLNTYRYSFLRGANYEISQFDPQVSAQLFAFSNPINQHGSRLFFGISGGYSFFSGDVKFS